MYLTIGGPLGSHTRKSDRESSRGRSRGGKGGRGESGGGKDGSDQTPPKGRDRQLEQLFRKASGKLQEALASNNFSYAANIATSVATASTPVKETMNLLLAGAKAFREGKEKRWEPKPSELAEHAIAYAQQRTGYELTAEKRQLLNGILSDSLSRTAEKYGRKSS